MTTVVALVLPSGGQAIGLLAAAAGTTEALRPPPSEQDGLAGLLAVEPPLEV